MSQLSSTTLIYELQKSICDILNQHYELSSLSIVPENSKDLEYEIGKALKRQGACGVVITPTIKFIGTDSAVWNAFEIDDLTIQIVENPLVNRAVENNRTAQDWGFIVSEVLTSPLYGNQGRFNLVKIENGEESGLLVTNVIVKTACESILSGMPQPPDYRHMIPFATTEWVSGNFISSVMSSDYATKVWVNEQGFLKEHQSLSDYYTKGECDQNFIPNGTLTPYATKNWVEEKGYLTQHQSLSSITELIPSQATSSNQLADKQFVNSSIATNTAVFRGTYNSVAELPTTGITNNDYAFVVSTDALGNTVYNRYKWNTYEWVYEYALNNSSFTANQWASINSGITYSNVTRLNSYSTVVISGEYEDSTTFNYRMVIEQ